MDHPSHFPPYRLLGVIPWGGREDRPVLGHPISPDSRAVVLAECVKLMRTSELVAALPDRASLEDAPSSSPIDPFAFEAGIRAMGGSYAANARISPLDVMLYSSRVVDRLLGEVGVVTSPRRGGYPTSRAKMRERVREIAADAYAAAAREGIALQS